MSSLASELTNPCSRTNLTQQWRREYRERISEEKERLQTEEVRCQALKELGYILQRFML